MAQHSEFNIRSLGASLAATVGFLTGPSTVITAPIGLFMLPVSQEFGLGRGGFAAVLACFTLLVAIVSPIAGRVMDRVGIRWIAIVGAVLLAVSLFLLSQARGGLWTLTGCFMAVGVAAGIHGPIAYSKLLSLWFHRRRGMMLSLAGCIGVAGGATLAPQLAGKLIAAYDWRVAYMGMGVLILIGLPILLLFLREPSDQRPVHDESRDIAKTGLSRGEALRQPAYLLVMISLAVALAGLVAMSINAPALLQSRGLDIGPTFLTIVALGSMLGQLSSAFLLDRINTPQIGVPYAAASFLGAVIVINFGFSVGIVLPAAFLLGIGQGAEIGIGAYYVSRYCGLKSYGELFGLVYGASAVGAALGPVVAGVLFDRFGLGAQPIAIEIGLGLPVLGLLCLPRYRFQPATPSGP